MGGWVAQAATVPTDGMLGLETWFGGPARNIGIACGPSGLVVLDEDADGEVARLFVDQGEELPVTLTVHTGRGRHFYFEALPDLRVSNSGSGIAGYRIDVRGDRGYVVAPGSVHESGHVYVFDDPCVVPAPLPRWLAEKLTAGRLAPAPSGALGGTDDDVRADTAEGLRSTYTRHLSEVVHQGGAFRHELFTAARDGWRLVALDLHDEDVMLGELADATRGVWGAAPDDRDKRIVYGEAHEAALASPWFMLGGRKLRATSEIETPPAEIVGRRQVRFRRASTITMRATDWAWADRLPLGGLSLVAGREGGGKSTLMYTLLAMVTRGALPGDLHGTPRNVAVAATEDSWELTIVPRLTAAEADLDRVFHIEVVRSDGSETVLTLPDDLDATEREVTTERVAVLLLDPLMSRLDGHLDTHKDAEVRQALEPLTALADRARCAVVGLIHLNKSGTADPLNAVMASKAFVAVARSVLFVARDDEDEQRRRRIVGLVKANLTAEDDVPALSFTIESRTVGTDPETGKPITAAALVWGEESQRTIGEVLASAGQDPDVRTAVGEAARWLEDYLTSQGGTAWRADIVAAGGKVRISEAALKRAATTLRVEITSEGFPRRSRWSLTVSSTGGGPSQLNRHIRRSATVSSRDGESALTELTGLTVRQRDEDASVSPVSSVGSCPPARELTGRTCPRCGRPADQLILGRCRPCAYPAGDAPDPS